MQERERWSAKLRCFARDPSQSDAALERLKRDAQVFIDRSIDDAHVEANVWMVRTQTSDGAKNLVDHDAVLLDGQMGKKNVRSQLRLEAGDRAREMAAHAKRRVRIGKRLGQRIERIGADRDERAPRLLARFAPLQH